jgi:PAT family beta-lactamase induction signal transducer AmpG
MLALLALGFSSGLPRLLVYSTLTFWLLDVGLSIAAVGLFASTSTPYTLKFLWAPVIDRVRLPWATRALGQRRAWMFATQAAVAGAILWLSATDPAADPWWTALAAVALAAASASQDVVIDAFRVEILDEDEQGAGAAVAVFGYRLGMLAAGAGALVLATAWGDWPLVYAGMAGLMAVGAAATALSAEPERPEAAEVRAAGLTGVVEQARDAVFGPIKDLTKRPGWGLFFAFIILYKLGDALAGTMLNPMLYDLGFTKLEIAGVAKTYGLGASIAGVFLGGWLVKNVGVMRALWIAGFMQMFSNLVFVFQARAGHDVAWLVATVGVENICGGVGTAAFVAYLSGLCNKAYTATQYALLTAASGLARAVLSTGTGVAAAALGWAWYFGATAACAVPGMLVLVVLVRRGWTGLDPADPSGSAGPSGASSSHSR